MTYKNNDDFNKLTFSQREGEAPLPKPMQLRHIPKKFRQGVWLYLEIEIAASSYGDAWKNEKSNIGIIITSYEFQISQKFHDEIGSYTPRRSYDFLKGHITEGKYHQVLTLIEFILRHECCSEKLREDLVNAFDKVPVSYFVDDKNGHPTIRPRFSREAGEATQQAIKTLCERDMDSATAQFRQAAEHIDAQQYADSASDSIGAVESVARRIDLKSKTLGEALNALERKNLINRQLKAGIEKIYAYTNTEKGIRHPLVFEDVSNVGLEDALFMYGACASLSAYISEKYRQAKERKTGTE